MKKVVRARVSEEFHALLEEAIHQKRSSQQAAVVEALTQWMGAPTPELPKQIESRFSKEQQTLIDQLLLFVDTASPEDVRYLKAMLAAQTQLVKAKEKIWAKQGLA